MRTNSLIMLLSGACFISPVSVGNDRCAPSAQAIPICTVLSDTAEYDGKEIIVEGLYRIVLHGSVLTSPACRKTYVNMRQASDYKGDRHASTVMRSLTKKDKFQSVDVIIRGTFHVAQQGQCFGQNCLSYEIEDHELICAVAPKPKANSKANHAVGHEAEHAEGATAPSQISLETP